MSMFHPNILILVHVKDVLVKSDSKSIQIRNLKYYGSEVEVRIDFGKGDHRRMISLNP